MTTELTLLSVISFGLIALLGVTLYLTRNDR